MKEIVLTCREGKEYTYVLHPIPYFDARRLSELYPVLNVQQIVRGADTAEGMRLLFSYVSRKLESGDLVRLETDALVANHVPDFKTGSLLEAKALDEVFDFFGDGGLLSSVKAVLQAALPTELKTLIQSAPHLLQTVLRVGESLETNSVSKT